MMVPSNPPPTLMPSAPSSQLTTAPTTAMTTAAMRADVKLVTLSPRFSLDTIISTTAATTTATIKLKIVAICISPFCMCGNGQRRLEYSYLDDVTPRLRDQLRCTRYSYIEPFNIAMWWLLQSIEWVNKVYTF